MVHFQYLPVDPAQSHHRRALHPISRMLLIRLDRSKALEAASRRIQKSV